MALPPESQDMKKEVDRLKSELAQRAIALEQANSALEQAKISTEADTKWHRTLQTFYHMTSIFTFKTQSIKSKVPFY